MRPPRASFRERTRWHGKSPLCAASAAIVAAFVFVTIHSHLRTRDIVIAYFVQASAANVPLVPGLLRALCDHKTRNVFAVHFDLSLEDNVVSHTLSEARSKLMNACCRQSRIHIVPREVVTYRGITLAYNYLTGAAHLLASGVWFDYFVNLSGADYPIARPSLVRELLDDPTVRAHRLSFIEWKPADTWKRFARKRVGRMFVDSALASGVRGTYEMPEEDIATGMNESLIQRNPIFRHIGFTVAKSSGWFVWHREFVEFLVLDAGVRRLLAVFSLADAADEHVFATAVWNNRYFRERAVPTNWRSIFFEAPNGSYALRDDGVTRSRQHPFHVDALDEGGKPLFWDELWNKPSFFTRKIRGEGEITKRIDRDILGLGGGSAARQRDYERRLRDEFHRIVRTHLSSVPSLDRETTDEFRTKFLVRE